MLIESVRSLIFIGKWLVTRDVLDEWDIGIAVRDYENPLPGDLYWEIAVDCLEAGLWMALLAEGWDDFLY